MPDFGRELCNDLPRAEAAEWLVTNGLGGYAMGTVAGTTARSYHGLLVAAMSPPESPGHPPAARTLLLARLDEEASYRGQSFPLYSNRRADLPGARPGESWITPPGYRYLERFRLEGGIPVWSYAFADALLEKRVWMQQGANTTYVRYDLVRAAGPVSLHLQPLATCRDHHGNVLAGGTFAVLVEGVAGGLRIAARNAPPFYILGDFAVGKPAGDPGWQGGFYLAIENYRGQKDLECYYAIAPLTAKLAPGQSLTVVITTDPRASRDGEAALAERRVYERNLLDRAAVDRPAWGRIGRGPLQLVLAADQFIVARRQPDGLPGSSVIAGYPWFGDWGRDTMIALPGLTLSTGRPEVARQILLTFARFVDRGMLPNRFPDAGQEPEYNTIDATLWYVEAIRAYHAATRDDATLQALYPVLADIIQWHRRGTRYNIRVDPDDGLVYGGEPGVQLTWMDAKLDDWVVTPRIGKPVEIGALWHNALQSMAGFADTLGFPQDAAAFRAQAEQTALGFARFWNQATGFCYDVLDGPNGHEASLRPNQLFAVSLYHPVLTGPRAAAVVDACARSLLTSHGLRSLAPDHPDYTGRYGGDRRSRDAAYHQGTVWGWLIGAFVSAHLRVHGDMPRRVRFSSRCCTTCAAAASAASARSSTATRPSRRARAAPRHGPWLRFCV
ncbi:MAG: amylo-alpha-1,6-glucosidase [Caldilineales bacterium]